MECKRQSRGQPSAPQPGAPTSLFPARPPAAGAKTGWRLAWLTLMQELAPQSKDGEFKRPAYTFNDRIGNAAFPVEPAVAFVSNCVLLASPP